jgi:5'-3' exonuclease
VATLARILPGDTIAVTGDRDLMQVASERARVLLTVNGGMEKWQLLDPEAVRDRYGVGPEQYVDMAVLRGDPSDGIPGVPGIGAKTAPALIAHFGSLDHLLEAAQAAVPARPLTPRIAGALLEHRDSVLKARTVATAVADLDITVDPLLPRAPRDADALHAVVEQWGVSRFIPSFLR